MMSAAVGFVGVLWLAGPRRSKRVRVDALNMCGTLGFTGTYKVSAKLGHLFWNGGSKS